jgi:hypothetical protein
MGDTITQIGRYEISRQLVDTALASVYDAFDPVERKPVAIRVPRTTGIRANGVLSLGLKHPGLMTVLSYEENHGSSFLVLEPFAGEPLDSHLAPGDKMDPAAALGLLRQLASALDYAHTHGSIHGSLHPSGILLNDRQEIKVLDLGPADLVGPKASAGQLLRAVHFLSPECIRDVPMDGRSDQFSLAVLAHRLLTGELPFAGTPLGVMFRIAYQGLERDAMRDLPEAAQAVFRRSLAKTLAERYPTCGEMVRALEGALLRPVLAPTRMADAAQFMPSRAPAPPPKPAERSWMARNFTAEALKYFGVTFAVCAAILGAVFYLLLPPAPRKAAVPAAAVGAPAGSVATPVGSAGAPAGSGDSGATPAGSGTTPVGSAVSGTALAGSSAAPSGSGITPVGSGRAAVGLGAARAGSAASAAARAGSGTAPVGSGTASVGPGAGRAGSAASAAARAGSGITPAGSGRAAVGPGAGRAGSAASAAAMTGSGIAPMGSGAAPAGSAGSAAAMTGSGITPVGSGRAAVGPGAARVGSAASAAAPAGSGITPARSGTAPAARAATRSAGQQSPGRAASTGKAKAAPRGQPKGNIRKKSEPEVELKPVEPKIIR